MSKPCRVLFSKTGRSRYISHLDLQHTIQRSFIRAGVAMKHTNGFNPHPYMSVALPLSVGCGSVCELLDFELDDNTLFSEIPKKLNPVLPEGLEFIRAYTPESKFKKIKWVEVHGTWQYDNGSPQPSQLNDFFNSGEIVILKKTKRGIGEVDISPAINTIDFEQTHDGLSMKALLSAQEPSLNPDLLVKAVSVHIPECSPDAAFFQRIEIFSEDKQVFR